MPFKSAIVAALVGLASPGVLERQSISTLSASQILSYTPFMAAAKCNPSLTQTWSCGDLTDAELFFATLDPKLFPGVSSSVWRLHRFHRTASQILSAVQNVSSAQGTSCVTTVGQSLGAALALLDRAHLRLQPPANICVHFRLDPIPTVSGEPLGYHHPSGEIYIEQSGDWGVCPRQDNPSDLYIAGAVPYV
ncbi:hypothetical protein BJV78DRAFT_1362733 [Lactifluus subvellereus]|nr:hypothetical protein BJV78DRAFT_1362733 [Lactifluus subvellereus]